MTVDTMSSFYDLMFEVSNEERVRILRVIEKNRNSFSGIARELDITTQEVSRHFNRLMEAGLTTRDREGFPSLTPFGSVILRQLESARFTSDHRDYFVSHQADWLPDMFLSRLGELSGLRFRDDVMVTVSDIIRILQEAEEYLFDINMPYVAAAFPHIRDAYDRGIPGKFLHGRDLRVPDEMQGVRDESFTDEFVREISRRGVFEERYLETDVVLYMNEKEVAVLCFPTLNNQYDFAGFTGDDPSAHEWCRDLFRHLWEKGRSIS
ncbi:MAG: ArsR family transcriptional regulator [Candidatus Bathyarchaeia archaeon]